MKISPLPLRALVACAMLLAAVSSAETQDAAASTTSEGCVAVTGATGFVAGHVIEILLRRGLTVHGTVRGNPAKNLNTAHLLHLDEQLPGRLKLFEADLLSGNPFSQAFTGCWGLIHVASPVMQHRTVPSKFLEITVKGTLSALEAAQKTGMKTVIVTSSVATMAPKAAKQQNAIGVDPYTVNDYNDVSTLVYGTYAFSKSTAENATTAWLERNGDPFRYASIHFSFANGPQQNTRVTSSNRPVHLLLQRHLGPFYIPISMQLTDVRDVAAAHVHALFDPRASGRYLVAYESQERAQFTSAEALTLLQEALPEVPLPSVGLPLWLCRWIAAVEVIPGFDLFFYDNYIRFPGPGYMSNMEALDFKYQYVDKRVTVRDTALSMQQVGLLERTGSGGVSKMAIPALFLIVSFVFFLCRGRGTDPQKIKIQ